MSRCPACIDAEAGPCFSFHSQCKGCNARIVARCGPAARAMKEGMQTHEYRDMCARFNVSHDDVKAAAASDFMSKGAHE